MIIIIIGILIIIIVYGPHLWARTVLDKYNKNEYFSGNGIDFARQLLSDMGIHGVMVEDTVIGDHYDPEKKVVRLTHRICGRKTLTAVVVAAHEVGHALQDYYHFKPLRVRTMLARTAVKIERAGAVIILVVPLFTVITRIPAAGLIMLVGGFATLCAPLLIHLITLPTEFDASFSRALPILSSGKYIPEEDISAARRILLACALTYVANALAGLLNIWRWIRILRR